MEEQLTIIISNYQQEAHLAETIESALKQRVNFPYRMIIVDDHSTRDRSRQIIREYAERYLQIEPIFADENGGYLTNVIRAKERTKTKYFCLLDAEDYWTDMDFLQRAYDFLEAHGGYSVYEANVLTSEGKPFISTRRKSGTYSKEMLLNNEPVPITQTTGMFFRNSIFIHGVPDVMKNAVGTRSERSFEGDTGRFMMHIKEGPAYYDSRAVGVYRLTENGIWNSLPESKKRLISARMQLDYYAYYGSAPAFFVNRAYDAFQAYLREKEKELEGMKRLVPFMDEEERLMIEDVYQFCKEHERDLHREKSGLLQKAKRIYRILRS